MSGMNIEVVIEWAIKTKQTFLSADTRPPAGWNWRRNGEAKSNYFSLVSESGETLNMRDVNKSGRYV